MDFFTVDPDALLDADARLNALADVVDDARQQHQRRADRTSAAVNALRSHNFSGLELWQVEQIWQNCAFGGLAGEFGAARDAAADARGVANDILSALAQRHAGLLSSRILELDDPIAAELGRGMGALGDLNGWLNVGNVWGIIARPWSIFDLLASAASAYEVTLQAIAEARTTLERLRQRALVLIEELGRPLSNAFNSETIRQLAEIESETLTAEGIVVHLVKNGGKLSKLLEASDVGPLDVAGAALDFVADTDHSMHSLVSHVYGFGAQSLANLNPYVALTSLVMGGIEVGSSVESWELGTLGHLQGGAWGVLLGQVSDQWAQTSRDAAAWGALFTDVGAIALDLHAGTVAAAMEAPALAPTVFTMENAAGSSPSHLGTDFGRLGGDALAVLRTPYDLKRSEDATEAVIAGDGAQFLAGALPSGLRQSVDGVIYQTTAFALQGMGI